MQVYFLFMEPLSPDINPGDSLMGIFLSDILLIVWNRQYSTRYFVSTQSPQAVLQNFFVQVWHFISQL